MTEPIMIKSMKMNDLLNSKKIISDLKRVYPNINTQNTKIVEAINVIKTSRNEKKREHSLKQYRLRLIELAEIREKSLDNQEASKKEKDNYLPLVELRKRWKEMADSVDKLIVGFYIFYPPLRSDWSNVKLIGGKFVFDKFVKRKEDDNQGSLEKDVIEELVPLLKFIPDIPTNNNSFSKKLGRITERYFGKKITINLFRKIHIFESKDKSRTERKTLANSMNHTIRVAETNYLKLDLDNRV